MNRFYRGENIYFWVGMKLSHLISCIKYQYNKPNIINQYKPPALLLHTKLLWNVSTLMLDETQFLSFLGLFVSLMHSLSHTHTIAVTTEHQLWNVDVIHIAQMARHRTLPLLFKWMLAVINESILLVFSQVEVCQYSKQTDMSLTGGEEYIQLFIAPQYCDHLSCAVM